MYRRLALALLVAPLAAAVQAEITFTPMASYHVFDSEKNVEDHEGYALALGWRFTPALALEAHHGRTKSRLDQPGGSSARDTRNSLDGYYAFNADGKFSPYVLLGAGQGRFRSTGIESKDTLFNAAVGAFYRFNDNVALRGEVRNVHNHDESLNDQLALLGLEFSPANAAQAEPTPLPEPEPAPVEELAAEPEPEPVIEEPVDSDGDGVPDAQDKCADTQPGVQVNKYGCPLDADRDGVPDYLDKCPDTAEGVMVDDAGCPKMLTETISKKLSVTFDSGKAVVKDEYKAEIAEVAALLKQYPSTFAEIQGHTDASGNKALNDRLSQQRADAVRDVLVNELGVDASRVTATGYGSSQPVADNATAEGRAQNRRVIALISGEAKRVMRKK